MMVLWQMPLFPVLMFLVTMMLLQWRYLTGRRRNNFSKRGLGLVLCEFVFMDLINAGVRAFISAFKGGGGGVNRMRSDGSPLRLEDNRRRLDSNRRQFDSDQWLKLF